MSDIYGIMCNNSHNIICVLGIPMCTVSLSDSQSVYSSIKESTTLRGYHTYNFYENGGGQIVRCSV